MQKKMAISRRFWVKEPPVVQKPFSPNKGIHLSYHASDAPIVVFIGQFLPAKARRGQGWCHNKVLRKRCVDLEYDA